MKLRKYTKSYLNNSRKGLLSSLSVTSWLIIINIICFIISLIFVYFNLINYIVLTPNEVIHGKNVWTILTHMFSHVMLFHLFANMFSLFFLGGFCEKIIGRKRFLWFYLIAGLFAGGFFVLLSFYFGNTEFGAKIFGSPDIAALGASGAIFGILGLLAVLIPKSKVYLILGPLVAIVVQVFLENVIKNSGFLNIISILISIYIFISIFALFSFSPRLRKLALPVEMPFWLLPLVAIVPLVIVGLFVELPIGNIAHFGGFLAGVVYGLYLRKKYSRKVKLLRKYVENE